MSPALLSKNTSSSTPLCEVTLEERLRCCQPPQARPVGYHHWSDLLFLHWRVPAEMLQPLLPRGLTVDTWDGSAWVGLVAFHISRLRPWWSPVLPWISTFPETNIRTYVHREGRDPAVWFFSLDAARWLAVQAARIGWHLNYQWAEMSLDRTPTARTYRSQRIRQPGLTQLTAELGPTVVNQQSDPNRPIDSAVPGTLEFFLVERYLLYSSTRRGDLLCGKVQHRPYPLQTVNLTQCEETLCARNGIAVNGPPDHALYSPGVAVQVYGLERVL